MSPISVIVLLTYGSLFIELLVFPVPSVASSRQLAAQSRDGAWRRIGHALRGLVVGAFLFLPLFLVFFPDLVRLTIPVVDNPHPLAVFFGLLFILAGRILSMGTAISMRRGQKLFRGEEPEVLITSHFFRFSRNPIVVGLLLMYVGLTFLFPHLLLGVGILVIAAHLHSKVRLEETHLEQVHGRAFREYCKRTRRYL
jgi:protein-S-isoprenylcysteine O-methyltransferase Ste14